MKPMPSVASLFLNNPELEDGAIDFMLKGDEIKEAQIEGLVNRFDDVMVGSLPSFLLRRCAYK